VTIRIIQLTEERVTLARFAARRGDLTFLDRQDGAVSGTADLAATLAALAEPATGDERVILALAPTQVALRQVPLPIADRRKVREILPLELKGELAQDTAELLFDAVPASNGTVMAFSTPRATLTPLLAGCRGAAMDPEAATYAPASWASLVPGAERQLTVALTDGNGVAVFTDGRPCFFRALTAQLAEELPRTLMSLELGHGIVVDRCYLFGAAGAAFTAARTAFPATCALLPSDGVLAATFAGDAGLARELASLAAVAREAVNGDPVNFRHGALAYTAGRERLRKSLRLPAILATCLLVALFVELGVRWQLLRRDLASLDRSIGAIYREVFPKRKPVDETAEIKAEIRRLSGSSADSATLATLRVLAEALGEGIIGVSEVESDGGGTLRIRGDARSLQAVNEFKGRLAGKFAALELSESRSKGNGEVSFVLRATGGKGGTP
jgi:general secretion pathway protein L